MTSLPVEENVGLAVDHLLQVDFSDELVVKLVPLHAAVVERVRRVVTVATGATMVTYGRYQVILGNLISAVLVQVRTHVETFDGE